MEGEVIYNFISISKVKVLEACVPNTEQMEPRTICQINLIYAMEYTYRSDISYQRKQARYYNSLKYCENLGDEVMCCLALWLLTQNVKAGLSS